MKWIFYIIIGLIAAGCSCEKRIARLAYRCDLPVDTIQGPIIIAYRDTTLRDTIPGETVYVERTILGDCPSLDDLNPITARTSFAIATALVEDGKLKLQLEQIDTVRSLPAQIPVEIHRDQIEKIVIREVFVKPKTWYFYMYGFYILLGLIIFSVTLYVLKK